MPILVSDEILNCIRDELSRSTESILLISAYCKLRLIEYFDSCLANKSIDKKLVVRFRPEDISSGASDLEIYPYCRDNGWKLYFRLDLHAKTYIFDRLRCVIGSANATSNGLNMGGVGNYEIATACELAKSDLRTLDLLLLGAVEMNDSIYHLMQCAINTNSWRNTSISNWPEEIVDLFVPDYSLLFAEDFPACQHPSDASAEDFIFLNLPLGSSIETIRAALCNSKCYQWLLNIVRKKQAHELYFGEITERLHNTILNDPKPYRKDIKQLLRNLLNWIDDLNVEDLKVDRPNYSQRLRYIGEEV